MTIHTKKMCKASLSLCLKISYNSKITCSDFNWHAYDKLPDFMQDFRKAELGWFVAVIPVITLALLNTGTVTSCSEKWHEYKT